MDTVRQALEVVGQALDTDPAVRGGVGLATASVGLAALARWLWPRRATPDRVRVSVDCPAGQQADVHVSGKG
jgi:hypothetical protein